MQRVLQALRDLLEPLDRKELLEMLDQQVLLALRALQGLKASKVMLVLQDLRVHREQLAQSERLAHKEYKE